MDSQIDKCSTITIKDELACVVVTIYSRKMNATYDLIKLSMVPFSLCNFPAFLNKTE